MPKLLPTPSYLLISLVTYLPCLSVVEIAPFHQLRIHGLQLRDVPPIPVRLPPFNHEPHLCDGPQQRAAEEAKHRVRRRSRRPLKRGADVVEIHLVAGQPEHVVIPLLWVSERARSEDTNVGRRDVLRLLRAERIAQAVRNTLCGNPRARLFMKPTGRRIVQPMLPAWLRKWCSMWYFVWK